MIGNRVALANLSFRFALWCVVGATLTHSSSVFAQVGTLAEPFPEPAQNAALHYQRSLIELGRLDDSQLAPLRKPLWETLPNAAGKKLPTELLNVLARGRFAVQHAARGSRIDICNFGIDFSEAGAAAQLPHVEGLVHVGRLLTLRGAVAESQGKWEEAAIVYYDGLRMGRHLTHQNTLIESLAGIEILRNNYFALARWASRCPSRPLVARAFGLLESTQASLVNPAQTLARETSIMSLVFDKLERSYPNGPWAAMILDSMGERVSGDKAKDEARATKLCVERGVPQAAFADAKSFVAYVGKIRATSHRFSESVTACMTLPPPARLKRASALRAKYNGLIKLFAEDALVDPVEIGALFAEHEAELTVARLTLAVAASKTEGQYPKSLEAIAVRFGGRMPLNPYTDKPVKYQTLGGGKDFALSIPALNPLPEVDFSSVAPTAAE